MIRVEAPGKLFIAGEYAVVEAGEPAVLVAVDRYVTVRLEETRGHGWVTSGQYGRRGLVWHRDGDRVVVEHEHDPYDFVLSTVTVVEELVAERGLPPRYHHLDIESELDDADGRKFGLGSSAAVTVATVRALDEFYALGLDDHERYLVALLASVRVTPSLSGGDLAASTVGGWLLYRAPDRVAVLERYRLAGVGAVLDTDWPGLEIRRLPAPATLRLVVGWTGDPASTEAQVGALARRKLSSESHYADFLATSREVVQTLVAALEAGEGAGVLAGVDRARQTLRTLAHDSGITIETTALTRLCDSAQRSGAAAKSSGAGGGDCGIVLAPKEADLSRMVREWEQHDIRHLDIHVDDRSALAVAVDAGEPS